MSKKQDEDWNIRPCHVCGKEASFERRDESMPPEGDPCSKCGEWICPDCAKHPNEDPVCGRCLEIV